MRQCTWSHYETAPKQGCFIITTLYLCIYVHKEMFGSTSVKMLTTVYLQGIEYAPAICALFFVLSRTAEFLQ